MYKPILVPLDGSTASIKGLDEAIRLASLTDASLRLIHVVDELLFVSGFETCPTYVKDVVPTLKRQAERVLDEGNVRAKAGGAKVETKLSERLGHRAWDTIVGEARAWNADLIVLGTHGGRGFARDGRQLRFSDDGPENRASDLLPYDPTASCGVLAPICLGLDGHPGRGSRCGLGLAIARRLCELWAGVLQWRRRRSSGSAAPPSPLVRRRIGQIALQQ
jgi:nucleotide-binding universal stress UspA family protein